MQGQNGKERAEDASDSESHGHTRSHGQTASEQAPAPLMA